MGTQMAKNPLCFGTKRAQKTLGAQMAKNPLCFGTQRAQKFGGPKWLKFLCVLGPKGPKNWGPKLLKSFVFQDQKDPCGPLGLSNTKEKASGPKGPKKLRGLLG